MLLPLKGHRMYYDLTGPDNGPVVCMTHSLEHPAILLARAINGNESMK